MKRIEIELLALVLATLTAAGLVAGCAESKKSSADGADTTDATDSDDGTDTTDATDGTDATDATDGTDGSPGDDLYAPPGEIPPCRVSKPLGAVCNPFPMCGSGCPDGYFCAVSAIPETGGQALKCIRVGTVPLGGVCDPIEGPWCTEGSCLDTECRAFCLDDKECKNESACKALVLPGKPTVCGLTQTKCSPIDPAKGCPEGTQCALLDDDTVDCKPPGAAKQAEACETSADCAPGHVCQNGDLGLTCALVCEVKATQPDFLCNPGCPEGTQPKILSDVYAACITTPPPVPCNLFTQDCEDVLKGCYPSNDGGTYCQDIGAAQPSAECKYLNECVKGSFCIGDPESPTGNCAVACDPSDAASTLCQTGSAATCTALTATIGYCIE